MLQHKQRLQPAVDAGRDGLQSAGHPEKPYYIRLNSARFLNFLSLISVAFHEISPKHAKPWAPGPTWLAWAGLGTGFKSERLIWKIVRGYASAVRVSLDNIIDGKWQHVTTIGCNLDALGGARAGRGSSHCTRGKFQGGARDSTSMKCISSVAEEQSLADKSSSGCGHRIADNDNQQRPNGTGRSSSALLQWVGEVCESTYEVIPSLRPTASGVARVKYGRGAGGAL
ncbi:hypothetical protein EVAR_2875_1 [Eumeta japonica]|uniref:Uncharacterized protein n=1 Tax=Eumeta variegata TaxID=151549 RepID=A0A4C1T1Q7_EUMVA|nr:hypothetical protein EVAR_2875_1 [Eumeta japonica]